MPQPPLTPPGACGSFRELAIAENAVTSVPPVPTYRAVLGASEHLRVSACAIDGVPDGGEAVVRFSPPSGGRWRLTAHGDGLRTLSTFRDCEIEAACRSFTQYDGVFVAPTLSLDLLVQRGESYAIMVDGCQLRSCPFTLTAARIGPLECPETYEISPCDAERTRCAIDPCDEERFVCLPAADPLASHPLESASVLVDRTEQLALVSARVRDLPTGPVEGPGLVFYEFLAADGTLLPPTGVTTSYVDGTFEDGSIGPRVVLVPEGALGAVRARLWFGLDPDGRDGALETEVRAWDRGSAGERCDVGSLATQCVHGHRCVASGARGTCVRSERLEITGAEAWYSRTAPSLRFRVEGLSPGLSVSAVRVELLDESGASLIELPLVHVFGTNGDVSEATFDASAELDRWSVDPALMARAATMRLRVITTESTESPPREVPIGRATELESGANCAGASVTCGEALTCVSRRIDSVCEPTVEHGPCLLHGHTAIWAPPGSGTYTIEGVPREWGGSTSCIATRTMSPAEALFVAPVSGRYVFESDGVYSFEVMRSCEMPACVRDEPRLRVEIELAAGERVPVRLLSDRESADRFSLRVVVP